MDSKLVCCYVKADNAPHQTKSSGLSFHYLPNLTMIFTLIARSNGGAQEGVGGGGGGRLGGGPEWVR